MSNVVAAFPASGLTVKLKRTRRPRRERKRLTPAVLEMRPPKSDRVEVRGDESPLWLRVTSSGERSFSVRARIKGQPQPVRITYGLPAHIGNLSAAREWARKIKDLCRSGVDPREEVRRAAVAEEAARADNTRHAFEKVAAAYLATGGKFKKNARGWKPRTRAGYARTINSRLVPRWKGRVIHTITRDEISDFLSEIADAAPVTANRTLAVLGTLMAWYQTQRGSKFTSPVVRGMAPTEETARDRVLSDDEIRLVWHVAGKTGTFGSIVQMLLLTGARKSEAAAMCHSQIGADGIWALPGEFTKNHEPLYLPLTPLALRIIAAQPRTEKQDIVFSLSGSHEFKNWGHSKAAFDKRVHRRLRAQARANGADPSEVKPLPNWRLHDLRRTARSLMARAKIRPDHAERVLNHKIAGVEGTYDRHSYEEEKRDALERLTRLIQQIATGEDANVVVPFPIPNRTAKTGV